MKYNPHYIIVNQQEVHKLVAHKVGASVWAVYSALCAFTGKSKSCFPSHQTIKDWLKADYTLGTICKAVKKLMDIGIIERKHRSSKERYVMKFRTIVRQVKEKLRENQNSSVVKSDKCPSVVQSNHKTRPKNKTLYKRKIKSSLSHWFGAGDTKEAIAKRKQDSPAKTAFSKLLALSPTMDTSVLNHSDKVALNRGLLGLGMEAVWLEWVMEVHGDKIPGLLESLSG